MNKKLKDGKKEKKVEGIEKRNTLYMDSRSLKINQFLKK